VDEKEMNVVLEHFGLKEQPFGVTPDPKYLYPTPSHREALASLAYGVNSGRGFCALIAKPGMGKTTLLFELLQQLEKSSRTVFLFQPNVSEQDFLRSLLADLGIPDQGGDVVRAHRALNRVLLDEARHGRRVVVVVDEAQNLDWSVLEMVRQLSNFETAHQKLIQIILAGQPQLAGILASPNMTQLRQRLSIIARLDPLSPAATSRYMAHRLEVAGFDFQYPIFTAGARSLIAQYSGGVPRNINNLCFNALSLAYAMGKDGVQESIVHEVAADQDLGAIIEDQIVHPASAAPIAPSRDFSRWSKSAARSAMMLFLAASNPFNLGTTVIQQSPVSITAHFSSFKSNAGVQNGANVVNGTATNIPLVDGEVRALS
jgi:general secretion pathway protein A